jgi:phosphatidylglycerophosphate synthase
MVTEQKTINSVALRYRLGTILLWLGVFIWAPFIFLRAIGEQPVFLFFLPFHLIGVIGGARLRSMARRELGMPASNQNRLHTAGHLLILLGILVWAPYLYLKLVLGQPVEVMNFLPFHLTGVLGGVLLHVISYMIERQRKAPR